ncbi:restriction endonuclease subunit S [Enterococcus lactis]|uniref:restriction endonuclease subunit S n=1 Tax=Enterococcus lactis TaxID=357441 RepID=UPI00064C701A|nr:MULTISPECIES: restriction endonuclease subunit S [Enterococcus]EMF0630713.1 restriction endonuclease subunit S [Enterococcus faecium]MCO5455495.1 restriction endonuclease subunit S [Enterococcus lactis]
MSNNTQPEIRFPGFTEDWEERKLNELAEFNPKSDLPERFEYVDLESVVGTELVGHRTENRYSAPSRAQRLAKKNDVFYQTVRPYQKNNYLFDLPYDNYVFSTGYAQMRPIGNGYFLLTLIQEEKFVNRVLERSTGTSYPAINSNDLAKLPVKVPADIQEQQKVGTFFKQIDNTITLHQRKLDLLKETKKGFLQKMFPKNGAKVPEIRFPGFTEDWEQRKLGDVTAEVFQGINTAGDKVEYSDTGTPILQAKHITGGDVTFDEARFLDKERYSNYFPKYVPVENDILFANIGTIGPSTVVRDESEFLVAWNILKITLKKPEIAEFIQLQLDQLNQKHYFDSVLTGNATKFVNKDEMLRTPISVPTIEEQKKVGVFFSNIQRAITLHQRKLDLLKETKKGFLQKMFV